MSDAPFELTPSPPDPQPVKVFKLDDYEWWAGYSLQGCIDAAREQAGADCYEDAETEGRELTEHEMRTLLFTHEDGKQEYFFARLFDMVAAGEQFPQVFASTEY